MTGRERAERILEAIRNEKSTDPGEIFRHIVSEDFVNMHGPEHHVLDGACLLVAYVNAGGKLDLEEALDKIMIEGLRMPGAACGLWGVCGAVTSLGAALAIIEGTGPLSTDGSWGEHMKFTSAAVSAMGRINGPRCCKRDGLIAMKKAVEYVNSHYPVTLDWKDTPCTFSHRNLQCIGTRCPYYPE